MLLVLVVHAYIPLTILHEAGPLSRSLALLPLALVQVSAIEVAASLAMAHVVGPFSHVLVVPRVRGVSPDESTITFAEPIPAGVWFCIVLSVLLSPCSVTLDDVSLVDIPVRVLHDNLVGLVLVRLHVIERPVAEPT